jgi:hypothetical protein
MVVRVESSSFRVNAQDGTVPDLFGSEARAKRKNVRTLAILASSAVLQLVSRWHKFSGVDFLPFNMPRLSRSGIVNLPISEVAGACVATMSGNAEIKFVIMIRRDIRLCLLDHDDLGSLTKSQCIPRTTSH